MIAQDPSADKRSIDKHTQIDNLGEDVDMPDAPSEESTHRRPRKLDNRSGKGPQEAIEHFEKTEDRVDRNTVTLHGTSTNHSTHERTEHHSRSFSSRQESHKRKGLVRGGTSGNSRLEPDLGSRKLSEDIHDTLNPSNSDNRSKSRVDTESELVRLKTSLRLLERERDEEIGKREKLEDDLAKSETRLALASQREEHYRISAENELDKRDANLDSIQKRWEVWKGKWETERGQLLDDRQRLLSERQNWISERDRLISERQQWEVAQTRSETDLKDIRTRWKQTAKELNNLRAQGQGFYQVDDNYLEDLIQKLRYNIRNFAIQYFSGKLPTEPEFKSNELWDKYMDATVDGGEIYESYINSPEGRPSIVQAFLWRIVVSEVFNNFRWAGPTGLLVLDLYQGFNPHPNEDPNTAAEVEALRKIYIWKATTVGLLLGSMDESQRRQANTELQQWKYELFKHVDINLRLLQPEYQEKYRNDFFDIIEEAVRIDEELCRQVSRVVWTFETEDETRTYNPDYMELESGETTTEQGSTVALVVAPAVLKQGKSTGTGFESIVCLLKMQVSCELPEFEVEVDVEALD